MGQIGIASFIVAFMVVRLGGGGLALFEHYVQGQDGLTVWEPTGPRILSNCWMDVITGLCALPLWLAFTRAPTAKVWGCLLLWNMFGFCDFYDVAFQRFIPPQQQPGDRTWPFFFFFPQWFMDFFVFFVPALHVLCVYCLFSEEAMAYCGIRSKKD